MESIEEVITVSHHYDSGIEHLPPGGRHHTEHGGNGYIEASRRRGSGGNTGRASKQWVLPVITTTVGRMLRHHAAGRAAAHHQHRGSGNASHHCDTRRRAGGVAWRALRQWLLPVITTTDFVHLPPGGRHLKESIEAVDTSRHRAATGWTATHEELHGGG